VATSSPTAVATPSPTPVATVPPVVAVVPTPALGVVPVQPVGTPSAVTPPIVIPPTAGPPLTPRPPSTGNGGLMGAEGTSPVSFGLLLTTAIGLVVVGRRLTARRHSAV
jgi:hypothetical protein